MTAEEHRRRERGEIHPSDVRYVSQYPGYPFRGFMIRLKYPRYKENLEQFKATEDFHYPGLLSAGRAALHRPRKTARKVQPLVLNFLVLLQSA